MAESDEWPRPTSPEHATEFFGLPVREYAPDRGVPTGEYAVRIGCDWDTQETFPDKLADLLEEPAAAGIRALVIGPWSEAFEGGGSELVVEALVAAREKLPALRALFLGDIADEEAQMSWIIQSDVSPLFGAFPALEELRLRGAQGLSLGRPSHDNLRTLTIETGGMPAALAREVASARLPKLERLDLWFGDENYGNEVTGDVLIGLLDAAVITSLGYLGLRDDDQADETAAALAGRPRPGRITTLDLSLGTLGDEGADALAGAAWIGELDRLDIHHHYVTPQAVDRLRAAVRELNAEDPQEPDDWGDGELHRYVAVGE